MPPKRKPKPAAKPSKKAAPRTKAVAKRSKSAKAPPKKKPAAKKIQPLDLSAFPPESVTFTERWICLACVSDVFTRHLQLAPRTARLEMKRYTPSVSELYTHTPARPWFTWQPDQKVCPYCGSTAKWLAP